jgi:hypothetical protein
MQQMEAAEAGPSATSNTPSGGARPANIKFSVPTETAPRVEKKVILQQQQRLLLLRHAVDTGGTELYDEFCSPDGDFYGII